MDIDPKRYAELSLPDRRAKAQELLRDYLDAVRYEALGIQDPMQFDSPARVPVSAKDVELARQAFTKEIEAYLSEACLLRSA